MNIGLLYFGTMEVMLGWFLFLDQEGKIIDPTAERPSGDIRTKLNQFYNRVFESQVKTYYKGGLSNTLPWSRWLSGEGSPNVEEMLHCVTIDRNVRHSEWSEESPIIWEILRLRRLRLSMTKHTVCHNLSVNAKFSTLSMTRNFATIISVQFPQFLDTQDDGILDVLKNSRNLPPWYVVLGTWYKEKTPLFLSRRIDHNVCPMRPRVHNPRHGRTIWP